MLHGKRALGLTEQCIMTVQITPLNLTVGEYG